MGTLQRYGFIFAVLSVLSAIVLLGSACQVAPVARETPTPTSVPGTPTPTATPTRIPTPTATPKPTPTPTAKEIAHQGIAPLMEQRARAILTGDKEAFMATVSDKDPEFYAAQETLFEYLQPLPFASLEFIVDRDSGYLDDRRQDWKLDAVKVEWRFKWRGAEHEARGEKLEFDFVQENGVWKITADEVSEEDSWWMLAPLRFVYTDHFLLFYHPNFADLWQETADLLEGAYDSVGNAVLSATGAEPAKIYVVNVASDRKEFETLGGVSAHTQGFVSPQIRLGPEGLEILKITVYLNGGSLREGRLEDFRTTIEHEMAHAVLVPVSMPFTPAWVKEGAAMYLAGQELDWAYVRRIREEGKLDRVELENLTADDSLGGFPYTVVGLVGTRYAFSNALTRYLIESFGEDAYWQFYLYYHDVPWEEIEPEYSGFSFGGVNPWANLQIRVTDRAVREMFGLSEAEIDDQVKAWIDEQLAS